VDSNNIMVPQRTQNPSGLALRTDTNEARYLGNDAHAGLPKSHPGHEGGSMGLPAESAMAVPTPERRCYGNEAQRTAHALAREFAHGTIM
jgi:hypothetical protein